jgi:hypothetical protein
MSMDKPERDPNLRDPDLRDHGLRRIVVGIASAAIVFCGVAIAVYYWIAGVAVHGWIHGGPEMLTGAMAGLFSGGLAAVVTLILLLRRR